MYEMYEEPREAESDREWIGASIVYGLMLLFIVALGAGGIYAWMKLVSGEW